MSVDPDGKIPLIGYYGRYSGKRMKFHEKSRFLRKFRKRYSLRLHMLAILLATACSSVLAAKILLAFNLNSLVIRYPLAVLNSGPVTQGFSPDGK